MKKTRNNRGWAFILLMLAIALQVQAQNLITLKLENKPLPAALKLIEREGGKNVIFSVTETEKHHVSADIQQKTQAEAIGIILQGTPFIFIERADYFAIQKKDEKRKSVSIRGKIINEKNHPLPYCNVLLLSPDSTFVNGCVTQNDGSFQMKGEEGVAYTLRVSYIGYTTTTQAIGNNNLIQLLPDSNTLEEVIIDANRANLVKTNPKGSTFFLSQNAQNATNIYSALSEIPMLAVNEVEHTISTAFGGQVMILVNGVPRGNALESIDPKDIQSVEVMDTPSARYLANGFTQVINIQTKRKIHPYQLLNISTEHNPGLYYGVTNGGYELGNDKYSFYVNGKMFYFNNNHYDQTEKQRTSNTYKTQDVRGTSDYYSYNVTLGGDWVINNKSYLSYNATLRGIPTEGMEEGNGTLENDVFTTDYHIQNHTKSSSWVNVYNLFHRYTFSKDATLENALNFTYNWNDDQDEQYEEGTNYLYRNLNKNKTDVYKGNYTAVFGKSFGKSALEIGNQLQYERMDLEQPSSAIPVGFTHSRWKEYLYADYTYNGAPFSFSASLGWDLTFNEVEGKKKDHSRLKYSVSMNVDLGKNGGARLFSRGYTVDPSSAYLNPYDTSADSLLIVRGNPSLTPYYYKEVGMMFNYSLGNFYIWPQLIYSHCTDMITAMGYYTDDNIYVSTYGNTEKEELLSARAYLRYTFGKWGEINYTGSFNRSFFYTGVKEWFSHRIGWNFRYKKVSLNGHVDTLSPSYTAIKKSKGSIESLTTLNWNVNQQLSLRASLRYFIGGPKTSESWIRQEDYYSFYRREFDERHNMVMLGLTYRWQNKVKARKTKKLNVNDNRFNLLTAN